jgi:hypothetical protein
MGSSNYIIYGLTDPRDGQVRYIGKSASGLRRPRRHVQQAEAERTYKANWIRGLLAQGQQPGIVVLAEATHKKELGELERQAITAYRQRGAPLTNLTDGGDGCVGRVVEPQTRERIAAALRGRRRSEDLRQKLIAATGGRAVFDHTGRRYDSIESAARELDLWAQNIRAVLRGRQRTAGGYVFSYTPPVLNQTSGT